MISQTEQALLRLWTPHYEVCGLILEDGSVLDIKNAAKNTRRNFAFDTQALAEVMEQIPMTKVMGMFHTHPTDRISPTQGDLEGWPRLPDIRYFIVTSDRVTEWRKSDDGRAVRISRSSMVA